MKANNFNIRVYGILKHPNGNYLLTDEVRGGVSMTKFVGGGLEFNEGLKDALKREFMEEMNLEIRVKELFYINDFLQISKFNSNDQLLSVYYTVTTKDWSKVEKCISKPNSEQSFRWVDFNKFSINEITFPIDKIVFERLRSNLGTI